MTAEKILWHGQWVDSAELPASVQAVIAFDEQVYDRHTTELKARSDAREAAAMQRAWVALCRWAQSAGQLRTNLKPRRWPRTWGSTPDRVSALA